MTHFRLRIRRSTVVLAAVFLATLVLYFEVRPPPPTPVRYLPVQPVPATAPKRATPSTGSTP
ncbi:MAG TPA: hypothetical protein VGF00_14755 [Acidimicrobiia bacterium]|jgi:hypothetical protein